MAQPTQVLDALALATLPEPAMVQRIAAMWLRAHNDRIPYNRNEVAKWVKREFGPLLTKDCRERVSRDMLEATKMQVRLRRRRRKAQATQVDPLTTELGSPYRISKLLAARLGPARRWVPPSRAAQDEPRYIDGDFYSGLVAALVPTRMRLRRINDPNLLVYRQGSADPMTRFVPHYITTVADAFIWLIPEEAREFLQMPGIRVEHDGEDQSVRLVTPWGTKSLPWRDLAPIPTE